MTSLTDREGTENAHVPKSGVRSLSKAIAPAEWLPVAFFDKECSEHVNWSLETLRAWISVVKPHLHSKSRTVYGGPNGVRNIVFALSRILQNLGRLKRKQDVPAPIRRATLHPNSTWSLGESFRVVGLCVEDLRRDIVKSTSILHLSYSSRSQAFETGLMEHKLKLENASTASRMRPVVPDLSMTSGVPNDLGIIESMVRAITARQNEEILYDDSIDASRVITLPPRRRGQSGRRIVSDESLPDDNIPSPVLERVEEEDEGE